MKFNLYKLKSSGILVPDTESQLDETVVMSLNQIEKEIVNEFIKKQEGLVGITNLGDELRRNEVLNKIFDQEHEGNVIIKLTGNKMSFLKVFVNAINDFSHINIYFFILDKSFGKSANLVDGTFVKLDEIVKELKTLNNNFRAINENLSMHIIEMVQFQNHLIENFGKYAFLHSK